MVNKFILMHLLQITIYKYQINFFLLPMQNFNFNNTFSFTFCSACNNKFQRLKGNDKIAKQKNRFVKKKEKKRGVEKITKRINKSVIKISNKSIDFKEDDISEFSE